MRAYYLAIDIGASSGRHLLGWIENEKLNIKEIYRFENKIIESESGLHWQLDALFKEILVGMNVCKALDMIPKSLAIDTWGVDYVLLKPDQTEVQQTFCYRDSRTQNMDVEVEKLMHLDELYARTGIQKQPFNTLYQLMAEQLDPSEPLSQSSSFLMIPDYFNYLLTGIKANEYTNASTTQLINPWTRTWDYELIDLLKLPRELFKPLKEPGTMLGSLKEEIINCVGFDCEVVMAASHDTASAVIAMPCIDEKGLFLSSGTWSLIGAELHEPNCSVQSQQLNFTNEGGIDGTIRFLKNIMGLWVIQNVKKELDNNLSYDELAKLATESKSNAIFNIDDPEFFAPTNMIAAIQTACSQLGYEPPQTPGDIARAVYLSLSSSYAKAIDSIKQATQIDFDTLFIMGGGANVNLLNQQTANETQMNIVAGPVEATAIGNILVQLMSDDVVKGLKEARQLVVKSFELNRIAPQNEKEIHYASI